MPTSPVGESGEVGRGHDHRGVLPPLVVIDRLADVEQRRPRARASPPRTASPRDPARRSAATRARTGAPPTVASHVAKREASVAAEMRPHLSGCGDGREVSRARGPRGALGSRSRARSAPRCRITASTTSGPADDACRRGRGSARGAARGASSSARARSSTISSMFSARSSYPWRSGSGWSDPAEIHLGEVPHGAADPDQIPAGSPSSGTTRALERRLHRLAEVLHLARPRADPKRGTDRSRGGSRAGSVHDRSNRRSRKLVSSMLPPPEVHRDAVHDRQVVDRAEEAEHRLDVTVDDLQGHPDARASSRSRPHRRGLRGRRRSRPRSCGPLPRRRRSRGNPGAPRASASIASEPEAVVVAQLAPEAERSARVLEHVQMLARAQPEDDHPRRVRSRRPRPRTAGRRVEPADVALHERCSHTDRRPGRGGGRALGAGDRPSYAPRRDDDPVPDPSRPHGRDGIAPVRPDAGDPSRRARPPAGGRARRALRGRSAHRDVLEPAGALRRDPGAARGGPRARDPHLGCADRDGRRRLDGADAPSLRRTKLWDTVQRNPSRFHFPSGESFVEAEARLLDEIERIVARHPRGRVVVGTHGDLVRHADLPLHRAPTSTSSSA